MAATVQVTITWEDRYGNSCVVKFHMAASVVDPTDALIVAIVDKINALVNPIGLRVELSRSSLYVNTAGSGAYVVEDKALLVSTDPELNRHTWRLPSPKTTVFLSSDHETVNLADTDVGALSTAIHSFALSQQGGALTAVLKGHRTTARKPLKH